MEQKMTYHCALEMDSQERTEAERAAVEATEALVVEAVKLLSRGSALQTLSERPRERTYLP